MSVIPKTQSGLLGLHDAICSFNVFEQPFKARERTTVLMFRLIYVPEYAT